MIIAFSGHRNLILKNSNTLDIISTGFWITEGEYRNALWIHGGAEGFDAQVQQYITDNDISHTIYRPDYKLYNDRPKYAPIARNHEMMNVAHFLVCLWDGRITGGTFDMVEYCISLNKPFINLYHPSQVMLVNA